MHVDQALIQLRSLEPQLRADGVCALYLFGSTARGESRDHSDVDLSFDIAPDTRFSLFDQARLSRLISETLATSVDLIPRRSLHPFIKARIEAEQIKVFG